MDDEVRLQTDRAELRMLPPVDAAAVVAFYEANRAHHARWDPPHPQGFYTEPYWVRRLEQSRRELNEDRSLRLCLFLHDSDQVIGICNFTNVIRGPMQGCTLGYAIDHRFEGRGYMTEALRCAIPFAFDRLRLHRIQASYLPENDRSGRLLQGLGFHREGTARGYLYINGAWRDHVQTALLNPDPVPPPLPGA